MKRLHPVLVMGLSSFALLCILTALHSAALSRVYAQADVTATATPHATRSTASVMSTTAEILFPMAMRFDVYLTVNQNDIDSATIRVWDDETATFDRTRKLSPTDLIYVREQVTLVNHIWPIYAQSAPRLFTKLRYEWDVRLRNGEQITAGGRFIFEDTRRPDLEPATWQHAGTPPLQLHSHAKTIALNVVYSSLQRIVERVRADTGILQDYNLLLYDPGAEFCVLDEQGLFTSSRNISNTRIVCDPDAAERLYQRDGYRILYRDNTTLSGLQDQLTAFIVRDAYDQFWRYAQPPAWYREGIVQLYRSLPGASALNLVQDTTRTSDLLSLANMNVQPQGAEETQRLWFAQSYLMTLYLASRYGAWSPFALSESLHEGYTFEQGLDTIFGLTAEALYFDWRAWLFSEDAQAAVRWSVYRELTATPTFTPTATSTITPTSDVPKATFTPSSTITPRPVRSRTALFVPTNTPLPPGSLRRTLTPQPAPTDVGDDASPATSAPSEPPKGSGKGSSGGASGGLCGGAGLLILPLLAWTANRRRQGTL